MTFDHPFYRAALWLACCAATAAHAAPRDGALTGPAAADAAVPATIYQPLVPYSPAPPAPASPDRNWVALNHTVASYDAMSLTMGGMDGPAEQAGMGAEAPPPAVPAAHAGHASDASPAEHASPAGHAAHAGHAQHAEQATPAAQGAHAAPAAPAGHGSNAKHAAHHNHEAVQ